ncbi:MAG: DUF5916 domain-containing protein [Candidatus Tyrphobacter sp.]
MNRALRGACISAALAMVLCAAPALAAAPTEIGVPVLAAPPNMHGVIDASWSGAAKISLGFDYTYLRPAGEPTVVYVAQQGGFLDLAFIATQKEPLTQRQTTNGSNVLSDDYVGVYLYPNGTQGYSYAFFANPQGARYQTSSENSAYAPQWMASGRRTSDGYVVTMRIPLGIVRSAGSTRWSAQFVREDVATNAFDLWTYSPDQHGAEDSTFAGMLTGIRTASVARRNEARFQPYLLGERTTKANGGDTSRVGLDASIPVTATSSLYATLHPDYSNVELDQQTIAPTAFARQYNEVRPFFTQAASFFNSAMDCDNCPETLYTPAIPTFRDGYAYEGTSGPLRFAAFDAIGEGRIDDAQALTYETSNPYSRVHLDAQRVGVDVPGLIDESTTLNGGYYDFPSHLAFYTNIGEDRQQSALGATSGGYLESGFTYVDATSVAEFNVMNVGADYLPADGYVAQNDIYGDEFYGNHAFNFSPSFVLHDIGISEYWGRFHNAAGTTDQTDSSSQVNFDFKNLLTVHLYNVVSSIGVLPVANDAGRYELLPFDASGVYVGYKVNTTTPSYVEYSGGPYYHGHLDSWSYVTTIPLAHKLNLALEADTDRYLPNTAIEPATNQWLERASLDWQMNRFSEVLVGVRRIIGANLPNAFQLPTYASATPCAADPYVPGCFVNASNVSLAYHFLAARNEFYVVYGDPNNLLTLPALFVKWIRYIGAEKGT